MLLSNANFEQKQISIIQSNIAAIKQDIKHHKVFITSDKLKIHRPKYTDIIDLFVIHQLELLSDMLSGETGKSLVFDLNRKSNDKNKQVWKTYISSAQTSFFGIQYRITEETFGGSDDYEFLDFQKKIIQNLKQNRIALSLTKDVNISDNQSFNKGNAFFTRVFVINDVDFSDKELNRVFTVMELQSSFGIHVRYILQSHYEAIAKDYYENIESPDFCLIDRDYEDEIGENVARNSRGKCLLVVKLDTKYENGNIKYYKKQFEITTEDDYKLNAAKKIISTLLAGRITTFFNKNLIYHQSLPEFNKTIRKIMTQDNEQNKTSLFTERFLIETADEKLSALIYRIKPYQKPEILFLHGAGESTKERLTYIAQPIAKEKKVPALLFDFSSHGDSTGDRKKSTLEKRVVEAKKAMEYFDQKKKIKIIASSMGGYVAMRLIETGRIGSLVLFSPSVYSDESFSEPMDGIAFTNAIKVEQSWKNSIVYSNLEKYKGKLLLITGEKDEVVGQHEDNWIFKKIYNSCGSTSADKKWHIIKGAPHLLHNRWFPNHLEDFEEILPMIYKFILD